MLGTKPPKRRRFVGSNDRIHELPEGSLPCRSCGVAVTTYVDTPTEILTIRGQRNAHGFGSDAQILVTRCNVCAARRERAALILRDHPAVDRAHGDVALDRLDAAMAALDVLERLGIAEALTVSDAAVHELIDLLAALGGWCSWSATSAAPGICASRRWGTVSDAVWEDARRALALVIRRRFEMPKPIAPPADRGAIRACAFCGIGSIVGKESDTLAIWGEPYRMPLTALGGWGGDTLIAHVCLVCRPSLLASGNAVGMPAVWLAAIRARGFEPRSSAGVVSLTGVRPWAALPSGTEPNVRAWSHVDIAALDHELKFTTFVRKAESTR